MIWYYKNKTTNGIWCQGHATIHSRQEKLRRLYDYRLIGYEDKQEVIQYFLWYDLIYLIISYLLPHEMDLWLMAVAAATAEFKQSEGAWLHSASGGEQSKHYSIKSLYEFGDHDHSTPFLPQRLWQTLLLGWDGDGDGAQVGRSEFVYGLETGMETEIRGWRLFGSVWLAILFPPFRFFSSFFFFLPWLAWPGLALIYKYRK